MITVICPTQFTGLLESLGARIIAGQWSLTSLPDSARKLLESVGAKIDGCKYHCWNTWFPNIYSVTKDSRCTVSFNTLSKRASGITELDEFVIGRARNNPQSKRRNTYSVAYKGCQYASETALARAFGVKLSTFRSRRQLGWSLDESLQH
jgi:hypothetical protein